VIIINKLNKLDVSETKTIFVLVDELVKQTQCQLLMNASLTKNQ